MASSGTSDTSPFVSVVMPVYNEKPEYLEAAVNSILSQTYSNFEFIIVDDGSGESTRLQLRELASRDPRYFSRHQHRGSLWVLS